MSDYDVANHGFVPDIAQEYEKDGTIHINSGNPAYVFYATKEHAANAIKKFIQEPLVDDEEVKKEADILSISSDITSILNKLSHAKQTNELCRSAVMQTLCDE